MIGAGNIGGLKSSWDCGYFNKNEKRLAWIEQEGAITDGRGMGSPEGEKLKENLIQNYSMVPQK